MKYLTPCLFALLLGQFSISQAAAETSACLPVEAGDEGTPIIHARIDDGPSFAFILDTAASGTTIDPTRAEALALPRDPRTEQAQGMGGGIPVHFHRATSVSAGPLILRDVALPSLPAPAFTSHDVAGLAGVDLFGDRLAIWTAGASCVEIAASGARPGASGWRPVKAKWLRPWKIMLPLRIGDVTGWGLLDTGAQHSVLNPAFAEAIGLTRPQLTPAGSITGIDGREMPLVEGSVRHVAVGAWRWDARGVRVGDLPVFARLSEAGTNLAIIGMDWLASEGFAIDYGRQSVWLLQQAPK